MIGLLEAGAVIAALLGISTWAVVVTTPMGRGRSIPGSPTHRLRAARARLYAPLWVPLLVIAITALPSLLGLAIEGLDHCLMHLDGHHHHLCWIHPPHVSGHVIGWLLPLAIGGPAGLLMTHRAARIARTDRMVHTLAALGRSSDAGPDVKLLDQARPMALAVGWWRPVVLISEGLRARIPPQTLAVVVAHERAHIARGDTRWAVLDRLAAALLPASVAQPLLDGITLAREQLCDEIAAERIGCRVTVAQALMQVARLGVAPRGVSIAACDLEARVAHLLTPFDDVDSGRITGLMLATLLAVVAWPLHVGIEYLLTALLH